MTEIMCFYICLTVVIVAVLFTVCYLVSVVLMHNEYEGDNAGELRRMQEQCNELYRLYKELNNTKRK